MPTTSVEPYNKHDHTGSFGTFTLLDDDGNNVHDLFVLSKVYYVNKKILKLKFK